MSSARSVVFVVHSGRRRAVAVAADLAGRLADAGLAVYGLADETDALPSAGVRPLPVDAGPDWLAGHGVELVVALGGDGTLLRAAELARPSSTPLLGVNLGHVGFLAEADRSDLAAVAAAVIERQYGVEERLTLDVTVRRAGEVIARDWALNDTSVEKSSRHRMITLLVEIDGRPLSRWSGDGVVCATPTGSTAYAFSAGGPVVWPSVEALLLVPISAHALFARPLVVAPGACISIEVAEESHAAVAFSDGRRTIELAGCDRIDITRGHAPVRLVRLDRTVFTERLVSRFHLPVAGWRAVDAEDAPAP
jgi:NAD+ kinase